MASSRGNTHTEAEKMEQIITEFYTKSLHIILESRTPYMSSRNFSGEQALSSPSSSSSSSSSVRPRDKWFNLALRECPAALENLDLWRQGNHEPMVVDVVLVQRPLVSDLVECSPKRDLSRNLSLKERYPYCWNYEQEEFGCETKSEKIIERWVVQYDTRKTRDTKSGSRRSSNSTLHTLYKKSILLLRSLYVTVRLLPAYKIYRELNSSGQIHPFTLSHRVASFAEPFTYREDAEMQWFEFTPVDTASGRLCLSVLYCSSLSDVSSEPSTPMSPQVIPDYVGSPLADPLKRFPSLPVTGGSASRGIQLSSSFSRRHSWSYDHGTASPPSVSYSPSPTHSEPHTSISNPRSHAFPPTSLPRRLPEAYLDHKKDTSFYEYCPSPAFSPAMSPSASPSMPISIPGSQLSKHPLQSDSAPFSAPVPKLANSPVSSNKPNFPPSPPLISTRSGTFKTKNSTVGTAVEKFTFGKEETRQCSGLKIPSSSSPQISFSRSSTRSFPNDIDDSEFPCPFYDDDDDVTDTGSRPESFDQRVPLSEQHEPGGLFPIKKSQDAAVGALVRMLKKAPPLRQEISDSVSSSQACRLETWNNSKQEANLFSESPVSVQQAGSSSIISSELITSKTTADALEELRGYRAMKNLLLAQSSKSHI